MYVSLHVCFRYFDHSSGKILEDFIGFAKCDSTTGESLAAAFIAQLTAAGVNIDNMRGQGYDGAANMSGIHRGVKTRIQQLIPRATYTHCKAHSLNLAIIHASKEQHPRNMMQIVQEVAFAFDYSAKRLLRFQEVLGENDADRAEMERRTKLKTLCETRWAARADALYTFKAAFGTVVRTLDELGQNNDAKAVAFKAAVSQFSFVITLVAVEHVLSACVALSKQLQSPSCDLLQAVVEAGVVKAQVEAERNDPLVWQALYEKAAEMAQSIDVLPTFPRAGRQANRPNAPAANASEYWRINMYLPFVDHLLAELDSRLLQGNERYCIQHLLPSRISAITDQQIDDIFDAASPDLNDDRGTFYRECKRWKTRCDQVVTNSTECLQDVVAALPEDLYPNVARCFHLLLAMPVSTASAERSFSSMRRLKTYLRSTMTTNRLSGLGLLHIHRDRELSAATVVDRFAERKQRRLALIFQDN